jgi:hypothetical protein
MELACPVHDRGPRDHQPTPAPRSELTELSDRCLDRFHGTMAKVVDGTQVAAIVEPPRKVIQEVSDRPDAKPFKQLRARRSHSAGVLHRGVLAVSHWG